MSRLPALVRTRPSKIWLVTREDSPSETSAGSMPLGSEEAANTIVPPDLVPPPPVPPLSPPPQAAATSARANTSASGRIAVRARCKVPTFLDRGPATLPDPRECASYQPGLVWHIPGRGVLSVQT